MLCPGCREAVNSKLETCPHCSFDLSKLQKAKALGLPGYEDFESKGMALEQDVEIVVSKPKHHPVAYFLAAVAVIVGAVVFLQVRKIILDRRATDDAIRAAKTQPAQEPAPPPAAPPAAEEKPAPAPEPEPEAAPVPAPVESVEWRIEGRVYDILTLKPVAGANLTFLSDDGGQGGAVSGADGRFRVKLSSARGGYRLIVDHADYAGDHFDEPAVNYRKLTLADRAALRNAVPKHAPWKGAAGTVRRDIALFPLSPDS